MKKFQIFILSILLSSVCLAQGTELTETLKKGEVPCPIMT
jgi:hypothetical protein